MNKSEDPTYNHTSESFKGSTVQGLPEFTSILGPVFGSPVSTGVSQGPAVKADGGGMRFSSGKPRYDLIPPEVIEAVAIHYMQGAKKYADRNWERGMNWGECYRALMSHAIRWHKGETYDTDPSMPGYDAHNMIGVIWNAIALYIYQTRGIGTDDRNLPTKAVS